MTEPGRNIQIEKTAESPRATAMGAPSRTRKRVKIPKTKLIMVLFTALIHTVAADIHLLFIPDNSDFLVQNPDKSHEASGENTKTDTDYSALSRGRRFGGRKNPSGGKDSQEKKIEEEKVQIPQSGNFFRPRRKPPDKKFKPGMGIFRDTRAEADPREGGKKNIAHIRGPGENLARENPVHKAQAGKSQNRDKNTYVQSGFNSFENFKKASQRFRAFHFYRVDYSACGKEKQEAPGLLYP
jgi:hypothetical protein